MTPGELREQLLAYALTLPDAWEDHPWEERVAKVGKKVFAFFGLDTGPWWPRVGLKLPQSQPLALSQGGVEVMGYGLGKSGWVSVKLDECDLPIEALQEWVEESYRAVAPKRVAARLDERRGS